MKTGFSLCGKLHRENPVLALYWPCTGLQRILFEFGKQYIRPKVTVHKSAETIQGKKLYEEIRYVIPWSQMPLFIELILDRFLIIF